jgi:hypothetical protein
MTYTNEEMQLALQIAFDSGDADAKKWLMKNPYTKPEILEKCFEGLVGNSKITKECRINLLKNPNTPPKILSKIVGDSQNYLVHCLRNKNCPKDIIKKVILEIAHNARCRNDIYGTGIHYDYKTRKGVVKDFKTHILDDALISKDVKDKIEEGLIIQDILE